MQVTVEKLSPILVEFRVTVPVARVQTALKRAYDNLSRNARIKGFRQGKIPQHVLQHVFGDRVSDEVSTKLIDDTLGDALKAKNIRAISTPQIEKPKPNFTDDFAYVARFEVTPDIAKVEFEGLPVKRPVYPVTDAMVDEEIEKLRRRHSTLVVPDPPRPICEGDTITFDFVLKADGKKAPLGEASNMTAEVGNPSLLPEIAEAVIGKEPGAELDVRVAYPKNYQRKELQGVTGTFHIAIKEVKCRIMPGLDNEFATDVGPYDTLDALREDVRAKLGKANEERVETEVAEALVQELCKRHPIPVPPSLVQQQAKMQENEIISQARAAGNTNARSVSQEMRESIFADAEGKVRAGLLMAEIAKAKRIQISEADMQSAYVELAEQTGQNVNKIKSQYRDAKQREMLIGMILEDKVLTILEKAARFEGEPASSAAASEGQ